MAVLLAAVALAVFGISLLLAILSAMAAWRTQAWRFVFAALAFVTIAARAGLIVADGAGWIQSPMAWDGFTLAFDALIVGFVYAAVVKG